MRICDIQNIDNFINNIINLNFDNCYNNKLSENELLDRIEREISNNQLEHVLSEIQSQLSNKNNYKVESNLSRLYKNLNKLFNYLLKYRINKIYCDCDDYHDDYSDDNDYVSITDCYIKDSDEFTCRLCKILDLLSKYNKQIWSIYSNYILYTNNIERKII